MRERLRTRAVHVVARIALRFGTPVRAASVVRTFARCIWPLSGVEAAREAATYLEGRGTCLTRSLAVAARLPGAYVAIGVDPSEVRALAHAWVEANGTPLHPTDPRGAVIAKL